MNLRDLLLLSLVLVQTGFASESLQEPHEVLVNTHEQSAQTALQDRSNEARVQEVMQTEVVEKILSFTYHTGCPVPVADLRMVQVRYWNFKGVPSRGALIVHQSVASEILEIFNELFEKGFMIEQVRPVEDFDGSDDKSMLANNTSAFNCRDITGRPGKFSNHSWGMAIDINPFTNPYLRKGKVSPATATQYVDRTQSHPGSILKNSVAVEAFKKRGWTWGGDWNDPIDYQHFEKEFAHID